MKHGISILALFQTMSFGAFKDVVLMAVHLKDISSSKLWVLQRVQVLSGK